ncbi:MAG: hypothetical protein AAF771_10180 [Pseudomonadota bacterium]
MQPNRNSIIAGVTAAAVMAAAAVAFFITGPSNAPRDGAVFSAPGLGPMSFEQARGEFFRLTPALLLVVYDAFGRTEETEIYDTLASVAGGDALEQLYLERVGAMAGGGLEEADQTIHEITLLTSSMTARRDALAIAASWQVIGTVGHAEHLHVRGNTYSANLTVAPVEDSWKIKDFELLDVSRDAAGEVFQAPQTN